MLIAFFSNYYNHHQAAFCEALAAIPGLDFYFIETEPMEGFRAEMGWGEADIPGFVISAYESPEKRDMALSLAGIADAVIIGSAPEWYVSRRIEENALVFRYTERPMKEGWIKMFIPRLALKFYRLHYKNRHRNIYVLGASAYAAYDYSLLHSYPGRCLKFGYFPKGEDAGFEDIADHREKCGAIFDKEPGVASREPGAASAELDSSRKEPGAASREPGAISGSERSAGGRPFRILWTGRLLKLKRCDLLIRALGNLRKEGLCFTADIVGEGEMKSRLLHLTEELSLNDRISFHDFVKPDENRELMRRADIYVMTSNYLEGWGSVIYEALSEGCAVVASHACGCTAWLVKHGETGLVFESGNAVQLTDRLRSFLTDDGLRERCQKGAFLQMKEVWNPRTAAQRLFETVRSLNSGQGLCSYEDGPLSKADIIVPAGAAKALQSGTV